MKNRVISFLDISLKGYGQIFFCNSKIIGLIFLVSTFYNPIMAFTGLIGAFFTNLGGLIFHSERPYLKAGLFGANGVLLGLAWGHYVNINIVSIATLIVLSLLCSTIIVVFIDILTKKYDLPILSTVFVMTTFLGILSITGFEPDVINISHNQYTMGPLVYVETLLRGVLPEQINVFLRILGSTFFQANVLSGLIFLVCIFFYSKILFLFSCLGGFVSILMSYGLFGNIYSVVETSIGFNCILVSLVFGGLFIVINTRSILYAVFAVIIGFLIGAFSNQFLKFFNLPVLAFPFNLTTLLLLYPLRNGALDSNRTRIYSVPLVHIEKPEESLSWFKKKKIAEESQKVILSLPFYGIWFVSQGNNSVPTHQNEGKYAWDFIVVDGDKIHCSGNGVKNENYFCFGLPILSPADGMVVKVVNNVLDNEPGQVNDEENWGNYVVIDHGNNEFSEISHFKENSIIVKDGDFVLNGQLLGYCGNSGLSPEPHVHYQLQRNKGLGSETIPAVFTDFIRDKNGFELVKSGVPAEGDLVRNFEEV